MILIMEMTKFNIKDFAPETLFSVVDIKGDSMMKSRLQEMGFTSGSMVEFCGQAPFSGPVMFRLGTIVIALRENELACLELEKVS